MDPITFILETLRNLPPEQGRILAIFWEFIKTWWWLILPFILFPPFKTYYLFWMQSKWDARQERVLLEIKVPKEIIKPIKAMEYVIAGIHAIHDKPNFREKWLEGQFQLSIAFEIVSIDGQPRFFIRVPRKWQRQIESNIYAQYPEAEISEAEDYTKKVPQDLPNKDWNMWGADLITTREDPYPIRTYTKFEIEREVKEEKRVDPLAGLLEAMAALKTGEQIWVQIVARPIIDEVPWVAQGRKLVDKLVRRPLPTAPRPILQEAAETVIFGPRQPAPVEREIIPPEMKLTPGEREIVTAIEEKISKFGFVSNVRFIYLARQDVFFPSSSIRMAMGFFRALSTLNLNGFRPNKRTFTKIQWVLRRRRLYLRKRRLFRYYQRRWPTYFPRPGGTYILNSEELATLYHFPSRLVAPAPAIPRVEAKKGEPPPELPIE
jgi:hypothetical protein